MLEMFKENRIEKYGDNIEMTIDLIRHGEKDVEGMLTEAGKGEAMSFGQKIKEDNIDSAGIKVYTSTVPRAKETGEKIMGEDKVYKRRERNSLALTGKISPEFGEKLAALVNTEDMDESNAVQAIIDTGNERVDANTISSKEISRDVAKQILDLIRMTKKFKNNSKVHVVLVSHSGLIENFIVDAVKEERKDFIRKVGGQLDYMEGVRIKVFRKDKENTEINLSFRDYDLNLTEEYLEELTK